MKTNRKIALFLSLIMLFTITAANGVMAAKYNNLILESLYFTDSKDMVVVEPFGEKDLYPNVCIQKNESATPLEGKIIVAAYKQGHLEALNIFSAENDSIRSTETVFGFTRTVFRGPAMDLPEDSEIKALFWESEGTMIPFGKEAYAVPTVENQYFGEIPFPSPFKEKIDGRFTVTKEQGSRKYSHTATPEALYNWDDATEIFFSSDVNYLSSAVVNRLGTNREEPITPRNFATHYKAGKYKKTDGNGNEVKQTKFIFTLLNDFYSGSQNANGQNVHNMPLTNFSLGANCNLGAGEKVDALIRSGAPSGFTWLGTLKKQNDENEIEQNWKLVEEYSDVYESITVGSTNVLTLFNFKNLDRYGVPEPYNLVGSIAEVAERTGSFFQSGRSVYCNPRDGETLDDITMVMHDNYLSGIRHNGAYSSQTIMFENIGFVPRITGHISNQFYGQDFDNAVFGFFGCKFSGGAQNTICLNGKYTAYMVDSVAAYGFRDGFNYHALDASDKPVATDTQTSMIIELNSTSYFNGDYNKVFESAPVEPDRTNNSNNASTAHDSMNVLRVGARYWGTQGPITGDGARSNITMGVEAYDVQTTPSEKAIFTGSTQNNAYLVDCYGTGTLVRSGFIGTDKAYVLDLCGNTRTTKGSSGTPYTMQKVTWAEIASGVWKEPQPEEEEPAEYQNGVLTYPVVKNSFQFSNDYSDVQGGNNWYYMSAPFRSNQYETMPVYEKYAYYSASGWKFASNSWKYGIINRNYTSSGFESDPVLAFRAPIDGTVSLSLANGFKDPGAGGDGMNFNIYKVDQEGTRTKIFPTDSEEFYAVPYTAGSATITPFEPISLDVSAGDYLYYRVNMKGNTSNDNLFYDPVVTYLTDVGVYLNDTYCMLDIDNGVPVSKNLTYSGTAQSVNWASSDTDIVTVAQDGTVTPKAPGSAYITLTAETDSGTYVTKTLVDVVKKINPTPFANGDVIGMWGDSLTHGGEYAERIEEFYATKYPNVKIDMPKFGYSGDTTVDILNRIHRDFATRTNINRATVLLGANDFALTPAVITEELSTYTKRITAIINALKSHNINNITLITVTPFDGIRSGNVARAAAMKEYSFELRKIASNENCAIVDAWTLMEAYDAQLKAGHPVSADMPSLMIADNLHPSDLGYMVLAYSFLKAQGVLLSNAAATEVEFDTSAGVSAVKNTNCTVSSLTGTANAFSFGYTPNRLMYPKNKGYNEFKAIEPALTGEMADSQILKIRGINAEDQYVIKAANVDLGEVSGAALMSGVDLSAYDGALKKASDDVTTAVNLIDTYDDSLINILNFETRYLKTTGVITKEAGIALANQMVADGTLNAGSANSYITWKNSEESWRTKLATAWNDLYTAVGNRTVTITVQNLSSQDPDPDPDPDPGIKVEGYNILNDMTGTQGENCWYYRYILVGQYNDLSKYLEYPHYNNNKVWSGLVPSQEYTYGRIRMQSNNYTLEPGNLGDSALTFKAPAEGTITISMLNNIMKERESADINRFRIYKNNEQIFPTDGSWLTFVANETKTFEPLQTHVNKDDLIIFRVNKGIDESSNQEKNNSGDKLECVPIIKYDL